MPFSRGSRIWAFEKAVFFVAIFVDMLTKYTLTIGSTTVDIPDECLKNWDEISFSLKRTDYSGVIRSYSTEFEFCGEIADALWELYLDDGFLAVASVAVYTFTDTWGWSKQFEEALDFSTIEKNEGVVTINALDNTLAALIKAKKSTKYEYDVDTLPRTDVYITRMQLKSYAYWRFPLDENVPSQTDNSVCLQLVNAKSQIISKAYLEPCDESNGDDGLPENSFFMTSHEYGATLSLTIKGTVRCWLDPDKYGESRSYYTHESIMQLWTNTVSDQNTNIRTKIADLWNDNVTKKTINGSNVNMLVTGSLDLVFGSLQDLEDWSGTKYEGSFGIVGSYSNPEQSAYWSNNEVYEWNGSAWVNKGYASDYKQDRLMDFTFTLTNSSLIMRDTHIGLQLTGNMHLVIVPDDFHIIANWSDPLESSFSANGIKPIDLVTKLVQSISPTATVSIDADSEGLIAETALVAGESVRQMGYAKIYSTFQDFCNFMQCVFGYTYTIEGNNVRFAPYSALFADTVVKEIGEFNECEYSVNDSLIYSTVEIGFAKKDYSEIDGRLEKNFMNYYETGFNLTDRKYTMSSKYRADSYGIEFTARKSVSTTTDDKADEDIFILHFIIDGGGVRRYEPDNNDDYNPECCLERNAAFLAAMGNGDAVEFTMTASDGDNSLVDVSVDAGDNIFTAGELEFDTDDMVMPSNVNALVQIDWKGYTYTGFISEVECRFGKLNGARYKLIVKEITEIT